jgi:hypothetical protein
LDGLLERFETDDHQAVRSFLIGDLTVARMLEESLPAIEAVFGNNVPIALEPVVAPETNDSPELYALIRDNSGNVTEALERLYRFKRQWWYAVRPQVAGRLGFDVEVR